MVSFASGVGTCADLDELSDQAVKQQARCPARQPDAKTKARQAFESVGFDLNESQQFVAYANSFTGRRAGKLKGAFRWLYLVLVGLVTGIVAECIAYSLKKVTEVRTHSQDWLFDHGHGLWAQYLVWLGTSVALVSIAGLLVCYVEPIVAGSGISEIKCILNGIDLPNVLRLRTLVCKALGIVCSVGAGLPCGKEGPMIHSGAIVAAQVQFANAGPVIRPYRLTTESRDFIAAGAAAGVAAAFGAPIGGVLFAVEEGASHMNPRILVRTFVCAAVAALTVRTFSGPMDGKTAWGTLGTEVPVEFGRFTVRRYTLMELPIFALMGVCGGLLGALFNSVNTRLSKWRMRYVGARGHRRFVEVLVVTVVIVSINFFAPLAQGTPMTRMSNFTPSQKLFVNLGGDAIMELFHSEGVIDAGMLAFFAVVHYIQSVVTYGLGVPSGLFVPALLAGASFGRLVGELAQASRWGAIATSPGLYALVGATAMLSGMARITISLAVILMETTGEAVWSIPIFLTVMFAKWVGDLFNKGIYDIHIDLRHIPLLDQRPEKHTLSLQAQDIMATPVTTLPTSATLAELIALLGGCAHGAFPAVDPESQRFLGLIERSTLSHVLHLGKESGVFAASMADLPTSDGMVPYEDMVRCRHPQYPSVAEIKGLLELDDYGKAIDLTPYINTGAYTVQRNATVTRCHLLFRSMGLRHLPVLCEDHRVSGIVTRKDLVDAAEQLEEPEGETETQRSGGDGNSGGSRSGGGGAAEVRQIGPRLLGRPTARRVASVKSPSARRDGCGERQQQKEESGALPPERTSSLDDISV